MYEREREAERERERKKEKERERVRERERKKKQKEKRERRGRVKGRKRDSGWFCSCRKPVVIPVCVSLNGNGCASLLYGNEITRSKPSV